MCSVVKDVRTEVIKSEVLPYIYIIHQKGLMSQLS